VNAIPIVDALRSTPGVESAVAYSGPLPLVTAAFGGAQAFLTLKAGRDETFSVGAALYIVPSDYFSTAGIDLVRGRRFVAADASAPVAIVDTVLVQTLFADGRDPIGAYLFRGESSPPLEIVGVAEPALAYGPEGGSGTQIYLPLAAGSTRASQQFLVRSFVRGPDVTPSIHASIARVLPDHVRSPTIHALDDAFAKLTVGRRSSGRLMRAFGVVVLLVGAAGVYAVMAAMVAERRRELGIRLALGATRPQVVREILLPAGRYVAAGLAIGLLAGAALSSLARSLLFGVAPTDLSILTIVATLLVVAGLAAALPPAWRAAQVDPAATLKAE
jgi:ABC-type antimicrobial peptide transport system permease subunit